MNKEVEIAVTLNTDEANEKLEQLTAKPLPICSPA